MILDSEQQKGFLLSILDTVTFPGKLLDQAYALKKAIEVAKVNDVKTAPKLVEAPK